MQQKRYSRVRQAHKNKNEILKAKFARAGIPFPPKAIFRAFKHEKQLELGARLQSKDEAIRKLPYLCVSGVLDQSVKKETDKSQKASTISTD